MGGGNAKENWVTAGFWLWARELGRAGAREPTHGDDSAMNGALALGLAGGVVLL
jgi:hypothetical protein